jgi:RNA polymerase sigma-70 factor (ECF subfamily)
MQSLAELIKTGKHTERDRNRLASIMYPKLRYFIWKFFHDDDETEEVIHNTMLKIFKGLSSYSDTYRFTTWIYTIAKNEALLHQHKLKVQYSISIDNLLKPLNIPDDHEINLEKEKCFDDLYVMFQVEIIDMPDCLEKSILIDKEIYQMKGKEISEKYEMNLNTIKTKIRKARKMIKTAILTKNPEMIEKIEDYF